MVCCSSSCAALLIFHLVAVFIWFILKDRLFNQRFERQRCRSGSMGIPVTLILSYIFVGIMSLYAINLEAVSLFAGSSFTFLAVLNDVLYRFEWMNIVLFLSKKSMWKIKNGHPPTLLFITLPLRCPSRICLIKTLLEKTRWEKILVKEKEYIFLCVIICIVKSLTKKTQ